MKKNNRELKGLAKRGLAIVLCCLCLLATVPVSAMAQETAPTAAQEETPAAGGEQMENPQGGTGEESPQPLTEEIPEGKTVPTTQNVTPITTETTTTPNTDTTTTPNTETTTTPNTETTTTPNTETTTTPNTETTTTPSTETTTTPSTETTTTPNTETVTPPTDTIINKETETDTKTEEVTFYDQLMAAQNCETIFNLLNENPMGAYALTDDEVNALYVHVETLEDNEYKEDVCYTLEYLLTVDENGDTVTYDKPGGNQGGNQGGSQGGQTPTATSGTPDHIEIEISGTVNVKIGDEEFNDIAVTLTTSDTYTVTAYTLASDGTKTAYTGFKFEEATEGDGSTDDETVELSGSYPTGTQDNQVYYVVSVVKTVSVTLADGTVLEIPVTLTVTTSYWDEENNCPGIHNQSTNVTYWQQGYFISGSGIDVPISGEYVGQAITKGKLAIKKTVTGEDGNSAAFQFYLQNSSGEYLVFSNNAYTGTSATLTDDCKVTVIAGQSLVLTDIPVGTYTITEIQKEGYIITDAEGNESDNYTKDYIVETKSDDEIPIANFTNKKLSDEAGIKIKKVGSGLSSYPNPTVAIYNASDCTSGVPDEGATAVWTGTLTTNSGEFIYLNVTLPAGEYVVVETGADQEGYNLATKLTVDNTDASGMSFNAVANTVHELVVTNTYAEQPKVCNLTISKTVGGNMGDQNKEFTFTATLSGDYTFEGVTYSINNGEDQDAGDEATCTFTLKHGQSITFKDLPIGAEFTVTETSYSEAGYVTKVGDEATNTKTVTLAETNGSIAFVNTKDVTIDTGVSLETLPYILILGVVAVGVVLMVRRRRHGYDD